jgi:DNA polymerase
MLALEDAGYSVVGHVHDEAVSEVRENFGTLEESAKIMCPELAWAKGLPIRAEGYRAPRYRKES